MRIPLRQLSTLWLLAALAACGEGGGAAGPGGDAGAGIGNPKLEHNPSNVLSCFVSWTTAAPADSAVEFGPGGKLRYRIRDSNLVTRHRVLVIGLHEKTEYLLRASSRTATGEQATSNHLRYATRALPAYIPRGTVTVHDADRAHGGWTLMSVNAARRDGLVIYPDDDFTPTAIMYDMQGQPVWYNAHGLGRIGDTRFVDGHVLAQSMADISNKKRVALEIELSGKIYWEGPIQPLLSVHGHFHHHFEKLPGGTYLGVKSDLLDYVLGDVVVEMDRDHKELWTWRTFDYLRPDTSLDEEGYSTYSWTHVNALAMDSAADTVYVAARNISAIFKVRMSTKQILWELGSSGDFAPDPRAKYPWFQMPHGLERLPDGNLIMYDNGKLSRGFSRAVEYAIDEQARTSRIVWQYLGGQDSRWHVNYWGDADRLDNGNTLITAGTWKTGYRSRIFEVTRDKRVVWEMWLPIRESTKKTVGVYNSERLKPPLIEPLAP